ncbi:SigE family RNA polymerase sigma factor [Embleya scabrispora]|jgi:RNA polymerase sigma-70 factor (sigma-E family)|uniref:SigE family RNA polymerase sigma factor n=1 Tax=Embleya scabrispora TaxID=159449 RepID=UPI00037389A0|nr:SigE family RNA polymerase sigma factor [Embleya scabrispora]MYS81676.1 SigE family RNA polymerase sigma factor [Streptomyces sp. SID5474]
MTGDRGADFEEFAQARSGQLLRTACLLTGDWHTAEDLVQETLGKLFRGWRRIRHMEAPVAYAHTTLVRTFLSVRRLKRSSERPSEVLPEPPPVVGADIELRLTLLQGLARLSPADRVVLVLRYWEDRSVEETAEVLRISPVAVRVRAKRALDRLRALLGAELVDLGMAC